MAGGMMLKVKSSDNQILDFPEPAARLSTRLTALLDESHGWWDPTEPITMEDQHITGDILRRVVAWCCKHADDTDLTLYESDGDDTVAEEWMLSKHRNRLLLQRRRRHIGPVPRWDRRFLGPLDNSTLYGLIIAAHYLKIKKLRNIACATVANRLKNMNEHELAEEFKVPEKDVSAEDDDDDDIHLIAIDHARRG